MITAPAAAQASNHHAPKGDLRAAAEKMEAAFLSEMLKVAGVGTPRESFGGGAGEAQFASMLVDTYADAMMERGGIGLSERLFRSLAAGGS